MRKSVYASYPSDENTGPHAPACDEGIYVHNTWPPNFFFSFFSTLTVQHLPLNFTHAKNTQHLG